MVWTREKKVNHRNSMGPNLLDRNSGIFVAVSFLAQYFVFFFLLNVDLVSFLKVKFGFCFFLFRMCDQIKWQNKSNGKTKTKI